MWEEVARGGGLCLQVVAEETALMKNKVVVGVVAAMVVVGIGVYLASRDGGNSVPPVLRVLRRGFRLRVLLSLWRGGRECFRILRC